MKKLIAAVTALTLTSCSTLIGISPQERCALSGMEYTGFSRDTAYANTLVYTNNGSGSANTVVTSNSIHCSINRDPVEQCKISAFQQRAIPKAEWNEGEGGRNAIRTIGGFILIVPGVVAYLIQDGKKKEIEKQVAEIPLPECGRLPASAPARK